MSERKKDQVKALLSRRLVRGEYRFGDKVSAKALTDETGASRFMVITALNELRAEGFLEITAQVGVEVISPTMTEIMDFFVVFGRLEGAMVEFAAERRETIDLINLRVINDRLRTLDATQDDDIGENYRTLNLEFHRVIHSAAKSPRLAENQISHWAMADFFVTQAQDFRSHIPESAAEHDVIISALERRDAATARALMEAHIRRLGQDVVTSLSLEQQSLTAAR